MEYTERLFATAEPADTRTYLPLNVTAEQRANLELLWERSPATEAKLRFDMDAYMTDNRLTYIYHADECGTVACMAGRGPACGIAPISQEEWWMYVERVFMDTGDVAFGWCFDAIWSKMDNTLEGARKRLRIALDKGIPEDWEQQKWGDVPLCY